MTVRNESAGGNSDRPAVAAVGNWQLEPSASSVELHTKAMWGLSKVRATFDAIHGGGTVAGDGSVSGVLVIDASSVDTENRRRDDHLRGGDFFEVDIHPTFTYAVTGAGPTADGRAEVTGMLTVHGVSLPLAVPVAVTDAGPDRVLVTGQVEIDRSRWGITWGSKLGARMTNQVTVNAVFARV